MTIPFIASTILKIPYFANQDMATLGKSRNRVSPELLSAKFVSVFYNEYAKDLSCESVVMTRRGVGTKPNQGTAACPPATLDSQTPSTPRPPSHRHP